MKSILGSGYSLGSSIGVLEFECCHSCNSTVWKNIADERECVFCFIYLWKIICEGSVFCRVIWKKNDRKGVDYYKERVDIAAARIFVKKKNLS